MLNLKKSIFLMVCLMAAVVANAANWLGMMTEPENQKKIDGKVFYVITSANELAWFANEVNGGRNTINAILENDIVFYDGKISENNHAKMWVPMGTEEMPFKGTFDGAGFSVVGLYSKAVNASFIEIVDSMGVVKNLSVENSLFHGDSMASAIAAVNYGIIMNCESEIYTNEVLAYVGGICVRNYGKIVECKNKSNISINFSNVYESPSIGGIVSENFGKIFDCSNRGNMVGSSVVMRFPNIFAGGISGKNIGYVVNSTNYGDIKVASEYGVVASAGGVSGLNAGIIEKTGNSGYVFAHAYACEYAGGIAGNNSSDGLVQHSFNYGSIEVTIRANSARFGGGIVGLNTGAVKNVFSSGSLLEWASGGIVDENAVSGYVSNAFFNQDLFANGNAVSGGQGLSIYVGGLTLEEMKTDRFTWMLNATNGQTENSGVWTRKDEVNNNLPFFVDDCENCKPIYRVVFEDEGVRTIRYTNYLGKVVMPPDPDSYDGVTFVGWALENGKMVTESTVFSDDAIVDARYSSENALAYVVTFTSDNDEIIYTYITNENGKLSSLPEAPAPAEGYYFKGWYDEEFNRVNETTVFKANATLKALYGELSDVSYTITFKNADGTVLQTKTVKHGSIPEYTGAAPALEATAQYSYTFAAWDAAIVPATDDVVYTATYNATINSYTISFVDFDDSEIWSNVQPYGSSVVFGGVIPTRETTVAYSYTFKSWDKAVSNVTANATYKAVYDSTAITYEVVFKNGSVVLSTQQVEYGRAATAPASPTREGYLFSGWDKSFSKVTKELVVNALFDLAPTHQLIVYVDGEVVIETAPAEGSEYTLPPAADKNGHTFLGWYDAEGNKLGDAGDKITIVDDITITAKYEINKYTITFMFGSTKLQSSQVEYNKMPTYDGVEPSREKTAAYTYEFAGWTPVVSAATKDQVYNAVFDSTLNKFTIVFKSAEGVLQTKSVGYGAVPAYTGAEPAKDPTAQYEYSFAGWDPEITSVTAAKTYTAVFDSTLRAYKVTFKVDGEVVQSKSVFYGSKPSYTGDEPSRAKSENYTYEFAGWTPEIKSVTGAQTYTAVFDSTRIAKPASSSSVPNSSSSSGKGESSSSNKGSSSSGDKDALTIVKAAPQFSVEVQGRILQIAGAKSGAVYSLMDMQGRLLKQGTADANFTVEVPRAGTYLIRINKSISRVTVR